MVIEDDELQRMCKEASLPYFKILSQNVPKGAEENMENVIWDSQESNPGLPRCKSGLRYLVHIINV
jgi:hypothetical protein